MEETKAISELAEVMIRVNRMEAAKRKAWSLYAEEMDYFQKKHREDFSIDFFKMYDKYLERLEAEATEADLRLEELQPELNEKKSKLIEARKQKKIVELLKQKKKELYDEKLRKTERKELDEINKLQFYNQNKTKKEGDMADEDKRRKLDKQAERDAYETEREEYIEKIDKLAEYYEQLGIDYPTKK